MVAIATLDARLHAEAIKAAVTADLGPWTAYDYDDVPLSLPKIFAVVAVEQRFVPQTATGFVGRSGWRVSVRMVGSTVDEARWASFAVTRALNEKRLTIAGETSTPIKHESTQAIEVDDGRYSGWSIWTYAL